MIDFLFVLFSKSVSFCFVAKLGFCFVTIWVFVSFISVENKRKNLKNVKFYILWCVSFILWTLFFF